MTAALRGYVGISTAASIVHRDTKTIRSWCDAMQIMIHPVGPRMRYVHRDDFERLVKYAEANPYRRIVPSPADIDWDLVCDRFEERRADRDAEIKRRIEAARRWKRRHYGAYIDSEEIIETELAAMAAFPALK